jgi:hypothetical protein
VRPNSGRIEPGKEVEVSGLFSTMHPNMHCPLILFVVLLQAMKVEPALDARCRDKFLVQSVAVTADKEFTNISQIVRESSSFELEKSPNAITVAACGSSREVVSSGEEDQSRLPCGG